jgi:hypothetical protein
MDLHRVFLLKEGGATEYALEGGCALSKEKFSSNFGFIGLKYLRSSNCLKSPYQRGISPVSYVFWDKQRYQENVFGFLYRYNNSSFIFILKKICPLKREDEIFGQILS